MTATTTATTIHAALTALVDGEIAGLGRFCASNSAATEAIRATTGRIDGARWGRALLDQEELGTRHDRAGLFAAVRLLDIARQTAAQCDTAFAAGLTAARDTVGRLLDATTST